MSRFTSLQGQYLAFIDAYVRMHGRAPAESEMQRHFGVTPPSVHQMLLTLARKGLIGRVPGAARSLTLQVETADLPPLEPPRQRARHAADLPASARALPVKRRRRTPKKKPAKPDPMSEYVDSPMLTHRLKYEERLSVRVEGRYGVYRTGVLLTSPAICDCTCPSDEFPCKHVRALRATWKVNPDSFLDLQSLLSDLAAQPKPRLLDTIGQILLMFPEALGLLGIPGFERDGPDDENWAYDG